MYEVLKTAYEPRTGVDKDFLRKTARLVQEHTHTREISIPGSEHALTPEALKELAEQDKPDALKVFNLLISVRKIVEEKHEADSKPRKRR
jgi:type I restriction enzyme R subunit